ncbi:MAG TPA: transglycosylase SLT domain-containing protein [Nocardioidaceae bacterium]|nr:transglycosylase SLT domain-containing protein [Nocardioidaceae bacterium]
MSLVDVTARIHQIQGQLASLTAPAPAPDLGFAQVLAQATAAPSATLGSPQAGGADGGALTGGAADGAAVVAQARRYLGVPYVWGGTDPATGLDCSGLVQLVYRNLGIDLPRVSYDQATVGQPVPDLMHAQPGDILAFGTPADHVAIYIGNGQMIEAPHSGSQVRVSDVYETPSAIRRVLPSTPTPALGAARIGGPGTAPVSALGGSPYSAPVSSPAVAGTPYASLFAQAQMRYGVPASLLAAVAQQESGFDPNAVSAAGARGLMQLMPSTAATLGVNPDDPAQAVDGAARLLRDLTGEFDRTDLALAAYNAGPGAVHRYGGVPPYPETRRYVAAVLADQAALEAR